MADKDPSIRDSVIVVDNSTTNHVVSEKNDEYYCPSCNTRHPTHPKTYECISEQDDCKRRCEDCDAVLSKKYRSMHFDISGLCGLCADHIDRNNEEFLNLLNQEKLQGYFEDSILDDYYRGYYVPFFEDEVGRPVVGCFEDSRDPYVPGPDIQSRDIRIGEDSFVISSTIFY